VSEYTGNNSIIITIINSSQRRSEGEGHLGGLNCIKLMLLDIHSHPLHQFATK